MDFLCEVVILKLGEQHDAVINNASNGSSNTYLLRYLIACDCRHYPRICNTMNGGLLEGWWKFSTDGWLLGQRRSHI